MGTNITTKLGEFWDTFMHDVLNQYHQEDNEAMVKSGQLTVDAFRPDWLDSSDLAKHMHVGIAVLAAFQNCLHNNANGHQLTVVEAVAQSLIGVYGLGERRGKGEAYLAMGKRQRAARYIDPFTKETLPSMRRLAELKEKLDNLKCA